MITSVPSLKFRRSWKARGREAYTRHQNASSEADGLKKQLAQASRELENMEVLHRQSFLMSCGYLRSHQKEARQFDSLNFQSRQKMTALQEEANEDVPVNISALEDAKAVSQRLCLQVSKLLNEYTRN